MKWNTAISTRSGDELFVRGHALSELAKECTFSEVSFLLMGERMPTKEETELFNMMLVLSIEHGVEAPSAFSARVSASVGNPMSAALAAGVLATGEWHGGAIEGAMRYLESKESPNAVVQGTLDSGGRMPGFGHKVYKDKDPRAELLFAKAQELGYAGAVISRMRDIQRELEVQSGKHLPLNIDGALAALLCGFGFDSRIGKAFFIFARLPGMIAHIHEEIQNEKPYRRLDEGDVTYTGPKLP